MEKVKVNDRSGALQPVTVVLLEDIVGASVVVTCRFGCWSGRLTEHGGTCSVQVDSTSEVQFTSRDVAEFHYVGHDTWFIELKGASE